MHRHHPPTEDLDWALEVGVRHRPAPLLLSIFPVCAGSARKRGKCGTRGRRRFQQTSFRISCVFLPNAQGQDVHVWLNHVVENHNNIISTITRKLWQSPCITSSARCAAHQFKKKSLLRQKSLCFVKAVRAKPLCPVLNQLPQSVVFEDMIPLLWRRCG